MTNQLYMEQKQLMQQNINLQQNQSPRQNTQNTQLTSSPRSKSQFKGSTMADLVAATSPVGGNRDLNLEGDFRYNSVNK